ncbi:ABC transporter ATP-binding protein [Henriciella sp. AS95]|uniref:ABC transporter ATP-binding protein n=1 Tax=Henriciella sp. AS95 TaxID=3135782 RepID=UPI00317502E5
MTSIKLDNVSFSYPVRLTMGGRLKPGELPEDPRMKLGRNGRLKKFQVLSDISLDLAEGDKLAIIGRNGSGKSTLLRLLHSIFQPEQGTVVIDGMTDALFELSIGTRQTATGYQNIILGGLMRGFTKEEIREYMPAIVEFSGLGEFIYLPMSTYSAGMKARLLFSLATAFEPEILLLDEWVSAGDADFREKAKARMREHADKAGILVLASHSTRLLRANCNKALWLEKGRVVRFGELEEVFEEFDAVVQQGTQQLPDLDDDVQDLA